MPRKKQRFIGTIPDTGSDRINRRSVKNLFKSRRFKGKVTILKIQKPGPKKRVGTRMVRSNRAIKFVATRVRRL